MKKALIITYYWPPAGGPGVQRWLKFVKYLKDYGVTPVVYIPENPSYPIEDASLVREIPEGIVLLKVPIREPYKMAKTLSGSKSGTISKGIIQEESKQGLLERFLLFVRGNFFIPDARKAWVRPSVKFLTNYLKDHDIDALITTGPPHSLHLIGLELKRNLGVKWIADFRDPWTTIGYHKKLRLTIASAKKHKVMERTVLNEADQVIVTSQVTKQEFTALTNTPIEVITNGYDDGQSTATDIDKEFSISHIGSLLSERNPIVLWQALSELVTQNESFAQSFQLNLIGTVSEEVLATINDHNLEAHTNVIGYVPHEKALQYQQRSQLLLLIEIDSKDTRCIIPGKLFEYLASRRPILAFGPKDSDVERIIGESGSGTYFNEIAVDDLKTVILRYFERYKQGNLKSDSEGIEKYHRRNLTKKLAQII